MPEDEGLLLHRVARERLPHGPVARGRHLLRQVRDLPRRRGPRGRRHRLHRRPPPRLGGEPGRLGAPRPHAWSTRAPAGWTRCRSSARTLGPRRARGPRGRRRRPLHDRLRPLAHPAVAALHRRRARRGARPERLHRLGATGCCPAAALVIHDVFPDPADGGRPPYHVFLRALACGASSEADVVGSMRVLRRRGGDAGDPVG